MADKYLKHGGDGSFTEVEGVVTGGAPSANKIPALDASGRLDATMMPTGIGAETTDLVAFGNLAAGDFVNVFNDSGVSKVRKADASSSVAPANGFVLAAVTAGNTATVYWSGLNGQVAGLTAGKAYLSTTPGVATHIAPSAAGNIVQHIGYIVNSTTVNFEPRPPVVLA